MHGQAWGSRRSRAAGAVPGRSSVSSVGGPKGLGQCAIGAVGGSSVRKARVQITAPPLPRLAGLGGFLTFLGFGVHSCAVGSNSAPCRDVGRNERRCR